MITDQNAATARAASASKPVELPGFGPKIQEDSMDFSKFVVKHIKVDLDDLEMKTTLSDLETRSLRNDGVYILSKDKFTFMDKYFLVVTYLEKTNAR